MHKPIVSTNLQHYPFFFFLYYNILLNYKHTVLLLFVNWMKDLVSYTLKKKVIGIDGSMKNL